MPKTPVREFTSTCVVDEAGRKQNLSMALLRGLPIVEQMPERADRLAIVASGPSVADYLDELRDFDVIWAINGAYAYLLDQGIVPHGFFGMDPLPGLAPYVAKTDPRTKFYICSICDPSVFDNLEDRDVALWHPDGEGVEYPGNHKVIGGGTTAVTRAPFLALYQGFRDITLFGVESSFRDGEAYCYRHGTYECDIANERMWVEANGEGPFETEICLMKQVSQLHVMYQRFNGMLKFRCDGLLAAFMRAPVMDSDQFEMVEDEAA